MLFTEENVIYWNLNINRDLKSGKFGSDAKSTPLKHEIKAKEQSYTLLLEDSQDIKKKWDLKAEAKMAIGIRHSGNEHTTRKSVSFKTEEKQSIET